MHIAWLTDTVTSDIERAVHYTLLWGLEGVELRTVGRPDDRVPHVHEAKIKRRLADADIPVVAIAPSMFEGFARDRAAWLNEILLFEETARFAHQLGCSRVVVSAFAGDPEAAFDAAVDALRRAGDVAVRHGLHLAVLNEHGMAHSTGASLARVLDAVDHPAVRAAWNPADALRAGEAPAAGLGALGSRVALVRCSDGVVDNGWYERLLGEGDVGWLEQLRLLNAQGFEGPLSMEVYLEPRPKQGLRAARRLIELRQAVLETPIGGGE